MSLDGRIRLYGFITKATRAAALSTSGASRICRKMEASEIARLCGENAAKTAARRLRATVSMHYTRGLAVCA
jgi:hypothetical protein